ncbi:MAG: hypothetical protein R3239_03220 [Thermodesulfobacteriota bacterium]|nr:hypothetical protein [Thermodesulfobacteriota bacterium]
MKRIYSVCFALFLLLSSRTVAVAAFDGSSPLLCVPIEVMDCEAYEGCIETTVEDVNIPQFIRLDFDKKTASGTLADGTLRTVGIERMERENGMMVVQGGQEGRGWSATIGEDTGKMTLTASGDRFGFIIFGACTSP